MRIRKCKLLVSRPMVFYNTDERLGRWYTDKSHRGQGRMMMNKMACSKVTDEKKIETQLYCRTCFPLPRESEESASISSAFATTLQSFLRPTPRVYGIKAMHVCTFIIRLSTSPNTTVAHYPQSEPHSTTAAQTAIP